MKIRSFMLIATCILCACKQASAADECVIAIKNLQPQARPQIMHPPVIPFNKLVFAEGFCHGLITWFPVAMLLSPIEAYSITFKEISKYRTFRRDYTTAAASLFPARVKREDVAPEFTEAYRKLRAALANNASDEIVCSCITTCNTALKKHANFQNYDICDLHNTAYRHHEYAISRLLGLTIGGSVLPTFILSVFYLAATSSMPKPATIRYDLCSCFEDPLD